MKILYSLLLFSMVLFAHPHTFIDVYPTMIVKDGIAENIRITWKIDEMTSSMLIMDVDTNGDGKLDSKESKYIEENYFNIFADYNFYTYIIINGKKIDIPTPTNFVATIENYRVCYSFDLKRKYILKDTAFEFGDTDMYTAMVLKDEFVTIKGGKAVVTGMDNDFYYGYRLEVK